MPCQKKPSVEKLKNHNGKDKATSSKEFGIVFAAHPLYSVVHVMSLGIPRGEGASATSTIETLIVEASPPRQHRSASANRRAERG